MPGRLLWIVNPRAGRAEIGQHALACVDTFIKAGWDVTVHTTQAQGDGRRIAMLRAKEFDRVVCSGGDGTLGEVVSGIMDAGVQVPLGYIPAGTTNDFAASLGLSKAPEQAAAVAAGDQVAALDIGRFGERYFTYVAAFGVFTDVSYTTPQSSKNLLGRVAYLLEGMKSLSQIKSYPLHVEAPGVSADGEFIFGMVSNATSVGGFKGLPHVSEAQMDDGLFEVVLLRRAASLLDLQAALNGLLSGENSEDGLLLHFKTPWLRIHSETETAWTLDGEFGGNVRAAQIENLPSAVQFVVPEPEKPADRAALPQSSL